METAREKRYTINGMSCGHCTAAVRDEVTKVSGVSAADVDLETSTLTVRGEQIDDGAIRDAVDEAGYAVAP